MTSLNNISKTLKAEYDLRSICTSNNINKWSFKKPMNSDKVTSLTDSDRYELNDGFTLFTFNNPRKLLYQLQHPNVSNIWKYTDREAPYRLTDFEGYNHSGDMDFSLSFMTSSSGSANTTLKLAFNYDIPTLLKWEYFRGHRDNIDIVYLIYDYGTVYDASETTGVWVYKLCKMIDFDDNLTLKIPSSLSQGIYEVRLAFSTAADTNLSDGECLYNNNNTNWVGDWWALPEMTKTMMNVTTSGGGGGGGVGDLFDCVDFSIFNYCDYFFATPLLTSIEFRNMITLSDTHKDLHINVTYKYDNAVGGEVILGSASFDLNEGDVYKLVTVQYNDRIYVMSDAQLDNDKINIKTYAVIEDNDSGAIQTRTWSTNVDKTTI